MLVAIRWCSAVGRSNQVLSTVFRDSPHPCSESMAFHLFCGQICRDSDTNLNKKYANFDDQPSEIPSLKLTAKARENRPKPKRKVSRLPTVHFQLLWVFVSGRVFLKALRLCFLKARAQNIKAIATRAFKNPSKSANDVGIGTTLLIFQVNFQHHHKDLNHLWQSRAEIEDLFKTLHKNKQHFTNYDGFNPSEQIEHQLGNLPQRSRAVVKII